MPALAIAGAMREQPKNMVAGIQVSNSQQLPEQNDVACSPTDVRGYLQKASAFTQGLETSDSEDENYTQRNYLAPRENRSDFIQNSRSSSSSSSSSRSAMPLRTSSFSTCHENYMNNNHNILSDRELTSQHAIGECLDLKPDRRPSMPRNLGQQQSSNTGIHIHVHNHHYRDDSMDSLFWLHDSHSFDYFGVARLSRVVEGTASIALMIIIFFDFDIQRFVI